jgi:hypothetical protein
VRVEGRVAEFSDQVVELVDDLVQPGGGGSFGQAAGRGQGQRDREDAAHGTIEDFEEYLGVDEVSLGLWTKRCRR